MSYFLDFETTSSNSTCRRIHVEDLRKNDWIAVVDQVYQYPTCCWIDLDRHQYPPESPLEVWFRSASFSALKVKDIALPFIACADANGQGEVIDLRQCRIVKVPASFCKTVQKIRKKAEARSDKKFEQKNETGDE